MEVIHFCEESFFVAEEEYFFAFVAWDRWNSYGTNFVLSFVTDVLVCLCGAENVRTHEFV